MDLLTGINEFLQWVVLLLILLYSWAGHDVAQSNRNWMRELDLRVRTIEGRGSRR
jgi:hypothetical protein